MVVRSIARAVSGDRAEVPAIVAHGVGRALDELHALGVRHGDVKPANVLVGAARPRVDRAAERGATLVDLDLASAVEDGALLGGTPRYLAPEQRAGEPSTPAADVYALGLVLAEMLHPSLAAAATPRSRARPRVARHERDRRVDCGGDREGARRTAVGGVHRRARSGARLGLDARRRGRGRRAPRARATHVPRGACARRGRASRCARRRAVDRGARRCRRGELAAPDRRRGLLDARFDALAATAAPEAWTLDEIVEARGEILVPDLWRQALHGRIALGGGWPARWLAKPRPAARSARRGGGRGRRGAGAGDPRARARARALSARCDRPRVRRARASTRPTPKSATPRRITRRRGEPKLPPPSPAPSPRPPPSLRTCARPSAMAARRREAGSRAGASGAAGVGSRRPRRRGG